ncbi:unnamed protein product [Boreogadus saida]
MKGKLRICILMQRFQWIPTSLATYKGESMDEWLHSGMNNLFPINYNQRQRGPRRTLPPASINNTLRPHATAADGVRGITNIIQSDANTTAYLELSSTLDPS